MRAEVATCAVWILDPPLAQNPSIQISHCDTGRRILGDRYLRFPHEYTAHLSQIHVAFRVNAHVAGPPDVVPLSNQFALRAEKLHSPVLTVGHIDRAVAVHANIVRRNELPGTGSRFTPRKQQFALRRKLVYAGVSIAIRNVQFALGRKCYPCRVVERRPGAQHLLLNIPDVSRISWTFSRLNRHEEVPLRRKLVYRMTPVVHTIDRIVRPHDYVVRPLDHPFAPRPQKPAVSVEHNDRVLAPTEDIDPVLGVHCHARRLSHAPSVRNLAPSINLFIDKLAAAQSHCLVPSLS